MSVPLSDDHPTEKHVDVVETMLVDEDDDDDNDDDDDDEEHDDDRPQLGQAEHTEGEEQHQPVG